MLQALGREMARVRLMGSWTGTLPVTMRQAQSVPLEMSDARDPQHCDVGEAPLLLLPVRKFMHGVKLLIIELVQAVDI